MSDLDMLLSHLDSAERFVKKLTDGAELVYQDGIVFGPGCSGRPAGCCADSFDLDDLLASVRACLGGA